MQISFTTNFLIDFLNELIYFQIKKDARVRVERELRKMNLLETDYARKILSKVTPPSKPRRDNFSTIFKDTS